MIDGCAGWLSDTRMIDGCAGVVKAASQKGAYKEFS
jgi:hypothetical protein